MTQHIGLQREDESGDLIATFQNGHSIDLRIFEIDLSDTVCLKYIDPYGDTIFNQLQIPVLLHELNSLVSSSNEEFEFKSNLQSIVEFLEQSIEVHIHVRFIGD